MASSFVMKRILFFLKDYRKESIIAPLFKMLEAIFELIVPLVVAQIIDSGIANADTEYILGRCGILILLAIIGLVCATSAQFFAAKAAVGFATKLRSALFAHIQKLSYVVGRALKKNYLSALCASAVYVFVILTRPVTKHAKDFIFKRLV